MSKSSSIDIPLDEQRRSWNAWNTSVRERRVSEIARRQGDFIEARVAALHREGLSLLDVGCGTGWLCERLDRYGDITGTDLADEVLVRASARLPSVRFVAGNFLELPFAPESFDVVVSVDVLSHFADQPAFLARVAGLLRPAGILLLGTQNRPVLERWSEIPGPQPGQIRRWVDHRRLRAMLVEQFERVEIDSLCPVGDQGFLRVVNSVKLNRLLSILVPPARLERAKERALLGHSLMACACAPRRAVH